MTGRGFGTQKGGGPCSALLPRQSILHHHDLRLEMAEFRSGGNRFQFAKRVFRKFDSLRSEILSQMRP